MKKEIVKAPILYVAVALLLGILSNNTGFIFILFPLFLLIGLLSKKTNIRGALILSLFYLLGFAYYNFYKTEAQISEKLDKKVYVITGDIEKIFSGKKKSILVKVNSIEYLDSIYSVRNVILYAKGKLPDKLFVGDKIKLYGKLSLSSLDYKNNFTLYLKRNGVVGNFYVYKTIEVEPSGNLILSFRNSLINRIERLNLSLRSKRVLRALLLGDKSVMVRGDKEIFSRTGTSHLFAVSGLHLGVIITFILLLVRVGYYLRVPKHFILAISLLFIWGFALLVGFAASIVRAASMTTIFTLLYITHKDINIYNIIGLSMLIMLLINPGYSIDIGFQLSYSAVLGIVFGYNLLNEVLKLPLNNVVLRYFYELSLVSIAAQVSVLPITLYYFKSFPTYFLLSNIVAIPLVFVIVYLSIANLFLSSFGILSEAIEFLIDFLFSYLSVIESLPYSVLNFNGSSRMLLITGIFIVFMLWGGLSLYISSKAKRRGGSLVFQV